MRIMVVLIILFCCGADYKNKIFKRSKPPEKWDNITESIFCDNAFDSLKESRPKTFIVKNNIEENKQNISQKLTHDFDLSDMMTKLDAAETNLRSSFQNKKTFLATQDQIDQYIDIVIMMGRTLYNSDPSNYDDPDSFLKLSEKMKNAANSVKVLTKQQNFEEASKAFLNLQKNCNECHKQFRL